MACGFHASSVFAPTSGLRVAGASHKGGSRLSGGPPLAKLHFLQRRRSRIVWASPSTGHAGAEKGQEQEFYSGLGGSRKAFGGSEEASRASIHEAHFEPFWGHVEGLTLETVASEVASLSLRSIFSPKLCSCLGRALQKRPLNIYVGPSWGYVGPSGVHVGAMFAHLGVMLRQCCHIVASCWTMLWGMLGRRVPPGGDLGLCCFHDFTFIPKILLEKALPSGLRGTHSILATPFL